MKKASLYSILATACLITIATAKWSRLPGTDKKPISLNMAVAGSEVTQAKGISNSSAFLAGNPLSPITVAAGKSDAIIKFANQSVVNFASFVSDGLEGKVATSVSADGNAWVDLASAVFAPSDRVVKLDAGAAQGRYYRLQFELIKGGTIRNVQILGSDTDANYKVTQSEDDKGETVNFASGIGGGRLIYMSPETYSSVEDAVNYGRLEFPESNEKYRTAVYDLGQVRTLNEFGSVHSPRPVRLTVYSFETLPEKEDWRGRLAFDDSVFDTTEPVGSAEDPNGEGVVNIKPKKTVKSRYLALRWEPDFNPPGFGVSGVVIGGAGKAVHTPGGGGGAGGGGEAGGQGAAEGEANNPNMGPPVMGSPSAGGVGPAAAGNTNNPDVSP